jgi:glycosyltransferase involved in cell wall biosynthesis
MTILCVMQARNEGAALPGCLDHLRPFVDGFVALDDGSTDDTGAVFVAEPKMLDVISKPVCEPHTWDEPGNKLALLARAAARGAQWVLCTDADERWETAFLEQLHELAGACTRDDVWWTVTNLRELWNRPDQYRCDGIWARKRRGRFFRLPELVATDDAPLHGPWEPPTVRARPHRRLQHNLYHLKMIREADRVARRDYYQQLDPDNKLQEQGYAYLTDKTGLRLKTIPPEKAYDYSTLPPDLRRMLVPTA